MNRRSFLDTILKAAASISAGPAILPAALTYARRWKRPDTGTILVPFWYHNRWTEFCDPGYIRAMKRLVAAKPAFKEFGDLTIQTIDQKAFVESFFNKPPITSLDTFLSKPPDTWKEMPKDSYISHLKSILNP